MPGSAGAARPGERALIEHIRGRLPKPPASLSIGPGDDAAVIVPERGAFQILTTDAVVEGIHFERRFSSLADVGYKAIAVNVSDVAAMGGTPAFALLSFILPDWVTLADIDQLLDGVLEISASAGVAVAGGNLSRSPGPLIVDVTVTGHARPRRILSRGGGKPGDRLYVTGAIGGATAGLEMLRAAAAGEPLPQGSAGCLQRHRRPEPRTRIGRLLGGNRGASACMDLSDGLGDAVAQIAAASGTGAVIRAEALPVEPTAARWFEGHGEDAVSRAVSGGDDFELLFAVPARRRGRLRTVVAGARGVAITEIGVLTAEPDVLLDRNGQREPLPRGFTHF